MQSGISKTCTTPHKRCGRGKTNTSKHSEGDICYYSTVHTDEPCTEHQLQWCHHRTKALGNTSRQNRRGKLHTGFGGVSPRGAGRPGWAFFLLASINNHYLEKDKGLHCPCQRGADGKEQHPTGLGRSTLRRRPSVLYWPKTHLRVL